jgi:hypothetical protein
LLCRKAGGILVAINTRLNAQEIAYIIEDLRAQAVYYSPELKAGLEQVPSPIPRFDIQREFDALLSTGSDDEVDPWLDFFWISHFPRPQCNECLGHLSPLIIWNCNNRALENGRMAYDRLLYLNRADVFASGDDDVFVPVAELDTSVRVHDGKVASVIEYCRGQIAHYNPNEALRLAGKEWPCLM